MLPGRELAIEVAAGTDDGGLGTDAVAISQAITAADAGAGVVVLMDLGSAVLSAETALELLDDELRDRVLLSPAPLVEGLIGAAVGAAGGAGRDRGRRRGRGGRRGAARPGPQAGPPGLAGREQQGGIEGQARAEGHRDHR